MALECRSSYRGGFWGRVESLGRGERLGAAQAIE